MSAEMRSGLLVAAATCKVCKCGIFTRFVGDFILLKHALARTVEPGADDLQA